MDLDCVEFSFPFDQADELFPLPSLPSLHNVPVPQPPLISSNHKTDNNNLSQNPKNARRRKSPNTSNGVVDDENSNVNEHQKKKIIHRDVERQRRQQMSTLHTSLRSLLPPEYLKGKRSISDHMNETVKYIQHMESKIQELSEKRDELKRLLSDSSETVTEKTLNNTEKDSVVVRQRKGGVQVVLNTAITHWLSLSNILQALVAQRLEILNCNSININGRFLHTIECNFVDNSGDRSIHVVSELQHKLTNLEYLPLD